jgi:cytochrome c oxidase subunit III
MAGEATQAIDKATLWGGGRSPYSVTYGKMMMWFFLVSDALTFSGLLISLGFTRAVHFEEWPIGEKVFEALPFAGSGYPLVYVALMTFLLIISSVTMVLAVEAGHRNDKKNVILWLALTVGGGFFFLGSQAWEWYHFIHGSGGYFVLAEDVSATITREDGKGSETRTLTAGTYIYYDEAYGHDLHDYEHHLASHEDHSGHNHEAPVPKTLAVEKYKTSRAFISEAEVQKVWSKRDPNIQVFGANMSENEYGHQHYANFFFFVTGFHGFHVFSGVVINIIILIMVIMGVMERRGHYEMVEKTGLYWHFVDLVWVFVFTFFYLI